LRSEKEGAHIEKMILLIIYSKNKGKKGEKRENK